MISPLRTARTLGGRMLDRRGRTVLDVAYRSILQRPPDAHALRDYLPRLRTGSVTVEELGRHLVESTEFENLATGGDLARSLHRSRCEFVRTLPRARRILDLGGTHLLHEFGALVMMGYPYSFDEIVIVDLPPDERHPTYDRGGIRPPVETGKGPVRYAYHSMVDLGDYEDESFDFVYSGQTIEHITVDEADTMLDHARRVLRPGGWLGVDTPNARLTRLQQDAFIDPDHKYEYTVSELTGKIARAGFAIREVKGLNLGSSCLDKGEFSAVEVAAHAGIYACVEDCYLTAVLAEKPA